MAMIANNNELGPAGIPKDDVIIGLPAPIVDRLGRVTRRNPSDPIPTGKRPVKVIRDTDRKYPDLWFAVYIEGDEYEERAFAQMFVRAACRRAKTPDDADIVVFTGGVDVDPNLYGDSCHHSTHFDRERDDKEMELFLYCKENGIPMFGVCRGAQFLHVMHGGKLWQDVDNHQKRHPIIDVQTGVIIPEASSVHHQMVYPDARLGMQIVATSNIANRHVRADPEREGVFLHFDTKKADVEAFFYRDTCSFGVQGHPEYSGYEEYTEWCMQKIDELINCNPDCEWVGEKGSARYRIRPDLVAERQAMENELLHASIIESAVNKAKEAK